MRITRHARLGLAVVAVTAAMSLTPVVAHAASADNQPVDGAALSTYPGDPANEALLVQAEDRRLIDVREVSNVASATGLSQNRPYRLVTGNTYTLVLVSRDSTYTFRELTEIAPRSVIRQPDGSYLLAESIVIEDGATLEISSSSGIDLHMASTADAFVSIVTIGGSLSILGTSENPVNVSSWDPTTDSLDTNTADGRSYIRVIGGHAEFANANFDHLGFWSGMTGGVSLTGTELPDDAAEGAIEDTNPDIYGKELLAASGDQLSTLSLEPDLAGYSAVSARIQDSRFSDNAFGLFVTSADGVSISDTIVEGSLVDGIVMHRDVTNSGIKTTISRNNALDGFALTRAATGVELDRVTATGNGRNGVSIEGGALASGPSATGTPVGTYGNNSISDSTITDNVRYGIDVVGGSGILVAGNTVTRQEMGIVVSDGASSVTVKNNVVKESAVQGIALRSAGTDAQVMGNTVVGAQIGIYARDAGGIFERNVIEDVSNHALTLIGETGESTILNNTVSGSGPSAIDVARTTDTTVQDNSLEGWRGTKPLDVILRSIFQPLTVMWMTLGLLVLITAATSIGRRNREIRHPYANMAPLSSFTKGVVSPETVGGRRQLGGAS